MMEKMTWDGAATDTGSRSRFRYRILVVVAVLVVALLAGAIAIQLRREVPPATVSVVVPAQMVVAGPTSLLPWPTHAAAALDVQGVAVLRGVRTGEVRPLASLTKLITALVVLKDHPLRVGEHGPTITVDAAESSDYRRDVAQQQSVLGVRNGEQLTELQALEGMLIPSADNVARLLARWDAGSVSAFTKAMNAEAAHFGLTRTRLAGPSGLNPGSVGTAADMVRLGRAAMGNPVVREIVAMPQVSLPVAGLVYNLNNVLGRDGIIGVKTGSTTAAGGNFVFAAQRKLYGRTVTVIGAVLGATGLRPLQRALDDGERLTRVIFERLDRVNVLPVGRRVLEVRAPWHSPVAATTTRAALLLALPGEQLRVQVIRSQRMGSGDDLKELQTGEKLATVKIWAGSQTITVPVRADGSIPSAPMSYRLTRL